MKLTGHSKSKTYKNHSKTSTDIPSGYEYVAEQIEDAQRHVRRLDMHQEIMSGKGLGDLTGMSKARQTMWFNLGKSLTSDKYKKSQAGFTGSMSNQEYDKYVRKGISAEYTGRGMSYSNIVARAGYGINEAAQKKKKKRIS